MGVKGPTRASWWAMMTGSAGYTYLGSLGPFWCRTVLGGDDARRYVPSPRYAGISTDDPSFPSPGCSPNPRSAKIAAPVWGGGGSLGASPQGSLQSRNPLILGVTIDTAIRSFHLQKLQSMSIRGNDPSRVIVKKAGSVTRSLLRQHALAKSDGYDTDYTSTRHLRRRREARECEWLYIYTYIYLDAFESRSFFLSFR